MLESKSDLSSFTRAIMFIGSHSLRCQPENSVCFIGKVIWEKEVECGTVMYCSVWDGVREGYGVFGTESGRGMEWTWVSDTKRDLGNWLPKCGKLDSKNLENETKGVNILSNSRKEMKVVQKCENKRWTMWNIYESVAFSYTDKDMAGLGV